MKEIKPLLWKIHRGDPVAVTPLGELRVRERYVEGYELSFDGGLSSSDQDYSEFLSADDLAGAMREAEDWWQAKITECLEDL